jgi:hypothetical protein
MSDQHFLSIAPCRIHIDPTRELIVIIVGKQPLSDARQVSAAVSRSRHCEKHTILGTVTPPMSDHLE